MKFIKRFIKRFIKNLRRVKSEQVHKHNYVKFYDGYAVYYVCAGCGHMPWDDEEDWDDARVQNQYKYEWITNSGYSANPSCWDKDWEHRIEVSSLWDVIDYLIETGVLTRKNREEILNSGSYISKFRDVIKFKDILNKSKALEVISRLKSN